MQDIEKYKTYIFATLLDPRKNIIALRELGLSGSKIEHIKELLFIELKE
jgi:hypothetical protein